MNYQHNLSFISCEPIMYPTVKYVFLTAHECDALGQDVNEVSFYAHEHMEKTCVFEKTYELSQTPPGDSGDDCHYKNQDVFKIFR